ncbi:Uncharacterised protein [Mycobacterium tuberculosis]|nr:Uncharacterised protein [Mycobacterium tuberculosis]
MSTELTRRQLNSVEELFIYLPTIETEWGDAVSQFLSWNLEYHFKTKTFRRFVEWALIDQRGEPVEKIWVKEEEPDDENGWNDPKLDPTVWRFFYGYRDNYEKFSDDWVVPEERQDYLEWAHTNRCELNREI